MSNEILIKNAIAEGTKELIRQSSIEDITVTEICEKTGMNRRSFYRYFRDKFDVVNWIYYHDSLMDVSHYDGWSIFDYMPRIMESLYYDRRYYVNALKYKGQNSFREYATQCLRPLIEAHYGNIFSTPSQLEFFTHILCEMTFDACINWLSSDPCMLPGDFSAQYSDFLLKAFSTSSELLLRTPQMNKQEITIIHNEPARVIKNNNRK